MRRLLLLACLLGLVVPAAAEANKIPTCPTGGKTVAVHKHKGKVDARLWRKAGVVYGCSRSYPAYGKVVKVGRFTPRLVAISGIWVALVERRGGQDRVTVARLDDGSKDQLRRRAVPATSKTQGAVQDRVDAVRVTADGVFAWITGNGTLVGGGPSLEPAGEDPGLTVKLPDGTTRVAYVDGDAAVLDAIPELTAAADRKALLTGMTIKAGQGETDDCGGSFPITWSWTTPAGGLQADGFVGYVTHAPC